jgi:PAS domain S-box-containing protein
MRPEHNKPDEMNAAIPPAVPAEVVQQFLQSASIPLLGLTEQGHIMYCSRHAADVLQSKVSELVAYDVFTHLRLRDRSVLRSHVDTVVRDRQSARCEFEMVFPDLSRQWVRLISQPGVLSDESVVCWSSVENLTQVKRMEKTEAFYQRAASIQGTSGSLKEFTAQIFDLLRILFGIENGCLAIVSTHNGLIEFPFFVDQHNPAPVPRKPETGIIDYVLTMGRMVWLHDARSGSKVTELGFHIPGTQPSDWIGVPLVSGKRVAGMIAVHSYEPGFVFNAKDIGLMLGVGHLFEIFLERVELLENHYRLSEAIEQAAETVVITDPHGVIQYVNPAFETITGYTRDEVIGQTPKLIQSGKHDAGYYRQMWTVLSSGKTWRGRFTNRRKDGSFYEEEAVISPVRNARGELVSYVAVKRDVTRESRLEAQFFQAQKMQSASKLVEGISHDFRNLLMVIRQNVELLKSSTSNTGSSDELAQVLKAAEQSEGLIRQLTSFSEQDMADAVRVEPNVLIQEFEPTVRALLDETHSLRFDFSPRTQPVSVNRGQIEQALANLIINAVDAMPEGGDIEIRSRIDVISEKDGLVFAFAPLGQQDPCVIIEVADLGEGIAPARMSEVFKPGVTTKNGAAGLGLPVCLEIMRRHKGFISVQANKPRGSLFSLYFPVVGVTTPEPVSLQTPEPELAHGHETILLAEDEVGARRVMSRMLQDHGYNVIEAENGSMAIRSLLYHSGKIHLLLTDIMMPDFDGRALAEQIRGIQPEIKVLYVSGYNESHLEENGIIAPGEHIDLVKKPFRREDLIPLVRKVLDSK